MDTLAGIIGAMIPQKVKDYLAGKKTYVVMILVAVSGAAEAAGYSIPTWVYALEAAAGIGAIRVAISKSGGAYEAPKQ